LKKLLYADVKQQFKERGYDLLEDEYINVSIKMRFKCPKHPTHETKITYKDFQKGAGRYYCGVESRTVARKPDIELVAKEFRKRGYVLVEPDYKNNRTPMRFICPNHLDKMTEISYGQLLRGHGCIFCAKKGKPTTIQVAQEFEERGYKLLTPYTNSTSKLEYICSRHPSKILEIAYGNFKNGQGCHYCAGFKRYTLDDAKKLFSKAGYELLEDTYTDSHTPMRYKCPSHPDKETRISLRDLNRGTRCRYCYLDNNTGENHPGYNKNLTDEEREYKRNDLDYYAWRRKVFERDDYTCAVCGDNKGGNLIAHHKDGYGWCKERRTDESNGVTLCNVCHKDFHTNYGYKNNTESQYLEWIEIKEESE
jgi:hypothetical protein